MNEQIFSRTGATSDAFAQRSRRETRRAFLRRQFLDEATLAQVIFDITVGMVVPVLCLMFDPIVFRGGVFGQPLAARFQLFAYSVIAVEIVALGVWLAIGKRAGEWCGVLFGIMLAGALFSAVVGILLLPFSIIGLLFALLGVFGFTPFLTAFIYLRNARRALIVARTQMPRAGLFVTLLLGATLSLGVPAFAHWRVGSLVERSLTEILDGDDAHAAAAARRLRHVSWLAPRETDQLVRAYGSETDPARKARLARAYQEMTGDDIENRLYVLND
ncbi:MAG TPA: hypothetical protein VJ842_10870 [Pyrinomonadaceae bacterium]|nr:hypothetical protein [Pyrinomonadaceae bacterium]